MLRANAIAGAIALVGCCAPGSAAAVAAGGGCAQPASTADTTTLKRASDDVLCLVNGERTTRGLAPLRVSRLLEGSARSHSRDMVARRYFSHVSPGGMNARQRILRSGYLRERPAAHVGEAIAWGIAHRGTPAGLVRSFMNSPGHRRIVLDRRHRDVGVGLVRGAPLAGRGRGSTLTLDFGRR
jgi:uncharacterized protein YkwD